MTDATVRAQRARIEAARMYRRALAQWAMDLMALRSAGLDRPCRRTPGEGTRVRRAA